MLQLLNNGRKYNVKELAEILEVSNRMIRMYKDDLEKSGIFINSVRGPYGGYVLNKKIKLPARKFTQEDALFLTEYIENEKTYRKEINLFYCKIK